MHILICGGAGYIGSHMVKMAVEQGHTVTVFDNLSTGHRAAVQKGKWAHGDLLRPGDLEAVFGENDFHAVIHFAARSLVGESMQDPGLYYVNNVKGTLNLLEAARRFSVSRIVFSSTAAVYGMPVRVPMDEAHPTQPINPYGRTKQMVEVMLADYAAAYGIRSAALRYFNAAGAAPDGQIGEAHTPETHLIPNILNAALYPGQPLSVFGDDYDTPDGTCVRDYIHVDDLCRAHLTAIDYINHHPGTHVFNLGNGNGFSIREVIRASETVTGCRIPFEIKGRRPGDPAVLVADSRRAQAELGWTPRYTNMEAIIRTAWQWSQAPCYGNSVLPNPLK
ncbi:MAG: UDP-glucose 4-epimerase GalE [Deltaproteobacteria bacterium]|nr:MAG: UDP-glucose 4-epimerase GalE [Deltaproteobacteria bacterium]